MSYIYTYESRDLFEVNNKNIILTSSFYIPVKTNEEEYLSNTILSIEYCDFSL